MLSRSIIGSFIRNFEESLIGLDLFVALLAYRFKSVHHVGPLIIDQYLYISVAWLDLVACRLVVLGSQVERVRVATEVYTIVV
jgi:hypothetical protein